MLARYFRSEEFKAPPLQVEVDNNKYIVNHYRTAERIKQLPDLLIIQLKRFEGLSKATDAVSFPKNGQVTIKQRPDDPITTYEIVAYINHHGGSLKSGHYSSNIKELSSEKRTGFTVVTT